MAALARSPASGIRTHPLEHPLPLGRELVCRAQELGHPLHHVAQLGGARGRAVGLCVPQPRGDRLGLEGVRILRPICALCLCSLVSGLCALRVRRWFILK